MKNFIKLLIVGLLVGLVSGCSGAQSTTQETTPSDNSGFSKAAVHEQLKAGIHSPYQLIKATQESVRGIDVHTSSTRKLRSVLQTSVSSLMPDASESVQEEITDYLVKYHLENP